MKPLQHCYCWLELIQNHFLKCFTINFVDTCCIDFNYTVGFRHIDTKGTLASDDDIRVIVKSMPIVLGLVHFGCLRC